MLHSSHCLRVAIRVLCRGLPVVALLLGPPAEAAEQPGTAIVFPGVSAAGAFDPSLADTPAGARAWMSYSAVDPSPHWHDKNSRTITTRLAYSDDHGESWTDAGYQVNGITEDPSGTKPATWINEVSSLVFNPSAPLRERWKLFWHHYLRVGEEGEFQHGWIGYKSAETPAGLRLAKEVKLFGARGYDSADNYPAAGTKPPVVGPPLVEAQKLHGDLSMCLALSEPGAMASPSGIYMSLSCVEPKVKNPLGLLAIGLFGVETRIVLLKCDAPCYPDAPNAWRYISSPLTQQDASSAGVSGYSAPDLYEEGGKAYLMVSPTSDTPVKGSYNGCLVFAFTNLEAGTLERAGGAPRVIRKASGHPGTFNGASTYQPSVSAAGFLYGEITFGKGEPYFNIFRTGSR
jgi:hypothetical protein